MINQLLLESLCDLQLETFVEFFPQDYLVLPQELELAAPNGVLIAEHEAVLFDTVGEDEDAVDLGLQVLQNIVGFEQL